MGDQVISPEKDAFLVIMAGGSGTRFWPKSTSRRPKQLLSFGAPGSPVLLAQTLSRFGNLIPENQAMIVTTEALRTAVASEVSPSVTVLAEPQGRNTAPCIYWAAQAVAQKNPRGLMLVMPSDHFIPRPKDFQKTVQAAIHWAREHDHLVTLGIRPDRPETGYGYLRLGSNLGSQCRQVASFVEKPDLRRAEEFLKSGDYLWNGGMFVWRADVILAAFDRLMPEMKKAWEAAGGQVEHAYPKMTATSIDFGVMEKADHVVTFTLDCGWDDLGSWTLARERCQIHQRPEFRERGDSRRNFVHRIT